MKPINNPIRHMFSQRRRERRGRAIQYGCLIRRHISQLCEMTAFKPVAQLYIDAGKSDSVGAAMSRPQQLNHQFAVKFTVEQVTMRKISYIG
jgi:hypothetical protein